MRTNVESVVKPVKQDFDVQHRQSYIAPPSKQEDGGAGDGSIDGGSAFTVYTSTIPIDGGTV